MASQVPLTHRSTTAEPAGLERPGSPAARLPLGRRDARAFDSRAGRARIAARLTALRQRTLDLVQLVEEARLRELPCDALGPLLWDLGHMAHFEELWCVRALGAPRVPAPDGFSHAEVDHLFDASRQPRHARSDLALPQRTAAFDYLERVRAATLAVLAQERSGPERLTAGGFVWRLMAGHEAQHQETLLQSLEALGQAWSLPGLEDDPPPGPPVHDLERVAVPGGRFAVGADDHAPYDNERPAFALQLEPFEVDRYPVSNRRFANFVDDGGYARDELWSAEGRAWRRTNDVQLPLYWERVGSALRVRRRGQRHELDLAEPVQHVSWHEACAFAAWSGARLPTEFEWEVAASFDPVTGTRVRPSDLGCAGTRCGPPRLGDAGPASPLGLRDLHGSVYQWTGSSFEGYAGFRAFPYPEYSKAFFGRSYRVLRGSSWAAAAELRRPTYRNWDLPQRRQLFSGLRLAWS